MCNLKGSDFCDFLLAFLDDKALPKKGSTLKGRNNLLRDQILPFNSQPSWEGWQNEKERVTSPESVPIYLLGLSSLLK